MALRKLSVSQGNLGSIDNQVVSEGILKSYAELKKYYDFSWKFSRKRSRASTDFMMLTLSKLFWRPKNYFSNLHTVRLTGECCNSRLNVISDRGGPAVIQIMAGIAY